MRRFAGLVIGLCVVLSAWGCRTMGQPVTETTVDQELTTPSPTTSPPEVSHEEPRPGFEQESPKAQQP